MDKIGVGYAYISDYEKQYVNEALNAGRLSQGKMVHDFEKEFAAIHEVKYGVACNSGTSALHVALEIMKEKLNLNFDGGEVSNPRSRYNFYSNVERLFTRGLNPSVCGR